MAPRKTTKPDETPADEPAVAEAPKLENLGPDANEALGLDKGYIGTKPPGPDNEEFTLQTGPSSPTIVEQAAAAAQANADKLSAHAAGEDPDAPAAE